MSWPDRVRLTMNDYRDKWARVLLHVAPATTNDAVVTGAQLLAACSSGHLVLVTREKAIFGPDQAAGATGVYGTNRDEASLFWHSDTPRVEVPVTIPMPLSTLFLGDTVTINSNAAAVAALNAWLLANGSDENGAPLQRYVRGHRWYFNGP